MPWNRSEPVRSTGQRDWLPDSRPHLRRSTERRNAASRERLIQRVRREFEELRGLKLTLAQARRLFHVREDVCLRVLNDLVHEGILRVTPDNLFARRRDA